MKEEERGQIKKKVCGWLEKLDPCSERLWGRIPKVIKFSIFIVGAVVLIWHHKKHSDLVEFIGYLVGGALLYWQILNSSRRATAAEETVGLTEKGHIHERFKVAIEHLGNEIASVRLGGIYSLHQLAQDVDEYRKQVFEVLCSYIRESTSSIDREQGSDPIKVLKPTVEIQSILNLLFVYNHGGKVYSKLCANLNKVCLQEYVLRDTDLRDAELRQANLKDTVLYKANLRNARLSEADLEGSMLYEANLQDAFLSKANLKRADLRNANLKCSVLYLTNMQFSNLGNANLQYVDLRYVKNLKIEQLLEVETLHKAMLPEGMEEEIRRQKPELLENPNDKQKD